MIARHRDSALAVMRLSILTAVCLVLTGFVWTSLAEAQTTRAEEIDQEMNRY